MPSNHAHDSHAHDSHAHDSHARHLYAGPSHRAQRAEPPSSVRKLILAGVVVAATISSVVASASAGSAISFAAGSSGRVYFGVVGDQTKAQSAAATTMGHHQYGQVKGGVPVGRMITMGTSGLSYNAIASAGSGSATYSNIARWADTIKSRGGTILFGFTHEPEAVKQGRFGGSSSYIAAYRHVVDIFRARGVNNVKYVWQMTDYSFSLKASDPRQAAKWYPGDAYVDAVGSDAYNWYNCGPGHGKWRNLSVPAAPGLAFARAHGKQLVLPEFGSQAGSQRAQWLDNAHQWMIANRSSILGAFYFDRPATTGGNGCVFPLTSSADVKALTAIVNDTAHFSG